MDSNFMDYLQGYGQSFNPYAAGSKTYGGGRSAPNIGPVDKLGYRDRDAKAQAMRNAMLRRLQSGQRSDYMSSGWLNPNGMSY